MKLQQYLTEVMNIKNWIELRDILDKDCQPFIKELKGAKTLLYRGVKASPGFYEKKVTRTDRKPRLLDQSLHQRLSDASKEMFGWNIREEGVFATNNERDADIWGKPAIIFPVGKIEYVWEWNVEELYNNYDKGYGSGGGEWEERTFKSHIIPEIKKYKTKDLHIYLNYKSPRQSECIVKCQSYYVINVEWKETLIGWYGTKKYDKRYTD
jgi:hypothetical protein